MLPLRRRSTVIFCKLRLTGCPDGPEVHLHLGPAPRQGSAWTCLGISPTSSSAMRFLCFRCITCGRCGSHSSATQPTLDADRRAASRPIGSNRAHSVRRIRVGEPDCRLLDELCAGYSRRSYATIQGALPHASARRASRWKHHPGCIWLCRAIDSQEPFLARQQARDVRLKGMSAQCLCCRDPRGILAHVSHTLTTTVY